jgi:hypothetical protein
MEHAAAIHNHQFITYSEPKQVKERREKGTLKPCGHLGKATGRWNGSGRNTRGKNVLSL